MMAQQSHSTITVHENWEQATQEFAVASHQSYNNQA
jgi:hypothetical protein